jgi:hypothetical protein
MKMRALKRDRAARTGPELFLLDRTFDDCLDRIALVSRRFERALLIGCPDKEWSARLAKFADAVDVRDPGPLFASAAGGEVIVEDAWEPPPSTYDLVLAIGTLDTVNGLPIALALIRYAMTSGGLFIGAMSGGNTVPRLRGAMRAADGVTGAAAPHVHPRIDAAALAPLLTNAGFANPVVDVDRAQVAYKSFDRLVGDLRAMSATNCLIERSAPMARAAQRAAVQTFVEGDDGSPTIETFEILHFAAWTPEG